MKRAIHHALTNRFPTACSPGGKVRQGRRERYRARNAQHPVERCTVRHGGKHFSCACLGHLPRCFIAPLGNSDANVQSRRCAMNLTRTPLLSAHPPTHLLGEYGPLADPSCVRANCSMTPQMIERFLPTIAYRASDMQQWCPPLRQLSKQVWRRVVNSGTLGTCTNAMPAFGTAK